MVDRTGRAKLFVSSGIIVLAILLAGCSGNGAMTPGQSGRQSPARAEFGANAHPDVKIATITITLPHPNLPFGETQTISITARDSSGNVITGTYDHPIKLSGARLTFSPHVLHNSTEASAVALSWQYALTTFTGSTILAKADGAVGKAPVGASSGYNYFTVGTNSKTDSNGFQMTLGPDNKLYYGTESSDGSDGAVGQFDPTTGKATEIELGAEAIGLLFTTDGALWICGGSSNKLFRLPPGTFSSSALQTIQVPPKGSDELRNLAEDGAGLVWFTDLAGSRLISIPSTGPFQPSSLTIYTLPNGPPGTLQTTARGRGITYASDGNLYVVDWLNGVIDRVNPATGGVTAQLLSPQQQQLGSSDTSQPWFITNTQSQELYLTLGGASSLNDTQGAVDTLTPSTGAFSVITTPAAGGAGTNPYTVGSAKAYVYYADYSENGLGVINVPSGKTRLFPVFFSSSPTQPYDGPAGVAVLADGTDWFTCYDGAVPFQPLCLGHTVYISAWSIFPEQDISLVVGSANAQPIGMMEAPNSNSGPFTVTPDSGVCAVSNVSDHDFLVYGVTTGSCVVTVKDRHAKSQTLNVTVTSLVGSSLPRPLARL